MDFSAIRDYISKTRRAQLFLSQSEEEQRASVFDAQEALLDKYSLSQLTPRIVSLQTLYMLEGEDEEYSKLRRHGVASASTKGVSISFGEGGAICPDVTKLIEGSGARVGRLI